MVSNSAGISIRPAAPSNGARELLNTQAHERIRAVLETGPVIVFQPIVELLSRRVVGFESLSRFQGDPQRPPNVWFDEARQLGLHAELELGAVRAAIAYLNKLPPERYMSINVSPDVATSEELKLMLSTVRSDRVVLEITEQAVVDDYTALELAIGNLRSLGVRLAIDDVGAGFANMAHVVRLRPEVIKLDRSLISSVDSDPERGALVSSLSGFAKSVGASVVAEGVENGEEESALLGMGISHGQGYHFGRPAPLSPRIWVAIEHPFQESASSTQPANSSPVVAEPRKMRRLLIALPVVMLGLAGAALGWRIAAGPGSQATKASAPFTASRASAPVAQTDTNAAQSEPISGTSPSRGGTRSDSPASQAGGTPTSTSPAPSPITTSQIVLSDFRLDSDRVMGGTSTGGRVTLNSVAPAGGTIINLSSSKPGTASVPQTVTVPAGSTTVSFTVSTSPVLADETVSIVAEYASVSLKTTLAVLAPTSSLPG